jgi:hypothetical protein
LILVAASSRVQISQAQNLRPSRIGQVPPNRNQHFFRSDSGSLAFSTAALPLPFVLAAGGAGSISIAENIIQIDVRINAFGNHLPLGDQLQTAENLGFRTNCQFRPNRLRFCPNILRKN